MSYLRSLKALLIAYKWYVLVALVAIIAIGALIWSNSGSEVAEVEAGPRQVRVARVIDLMTGGNGLSVVAEIQSVSEAKISTESGGRITRVRASLGDRVGAGQVLAEIENSSQRAAVLQAEGSLDVAKASAAGAKESAVPTILGAYAAMDTAVEDAVGQIFTNPESSQPGFTVSTRDTQSLAVITQLQPTFRTVLQRHDVQTATLSESSDLKAELTTTEKELRDVRTYLDATLKVLNAGVPRDDVTIATISGYVADVTASRAAINASLSAVTSARTSLEASQTGTVSSTDAVIKQAEGAYQAALANLEKTIIRSPIAGTLNNFTVKLGDFVAPTQQVAIVSNNGALQAVAYVTEEDKARVAVGQKVTIENDISGTITRIAPALDPVTRRIEIKIGLPATANTVLTNGQSVRVELANSGTKPTATTENGILSIPITALKIEADRTTVFVVEGDRLVAKEITIGKLSGASVQVTEGLSADTEIVIDARGQKDGDTVQVAR
ncbi:MAG: HlyD family efflux transporter periplasmic adaptor subunit [Minisyncoccia bacterium]